MMLPGRCERCGAPVELRTGTNPIYDNAPNGIERELVTVRWEDRGTGRRHRCAR